MRTLLDALKTLKLWQIVVLVIVLLGAAGGTYGGYARVRADPIISAGPAPVLRPSRMGRIKAQGYWIDTWQQLGALEWA